ncbi:MAG: UDP-N-acetylmuramoyl-L-alanine--D-glutamate ligase [Candidatus Contendobacter odensis]|uniref:UDP-N-acetylmuramoylalanine--D-glutamate ligase n=1 Tax=Candidatus Contendibacter odensensis TaxID=1400860 RepID=A0A2G6PFX0_9GAMM|nr:MAG: UDP-N-acetylmuramoyl-L-alanine--D-glutamate ligase [Candidatus Contendobacter odensis]
MLSLDGITLIVGLGKSGLSALRALRALGATVAVTDSRNDPPGLAVLRNEYPDVPCHLGDFDPAVFANAARLLVSPGVPVKTPVIVEAAIRGVPVWGDIELFARLTDIPVVAITGSNGKSTVTTLLGDMMKSAGMPAAVGGNLGTPALDLWLAREKNATVRPQFYVLELSSFQLETTYSLNARVATVLNISPDHMDRYDSLDNYIVAKQQIFQGDGVMVVNADDPAVMAMVKPERNVLRFTLREPEDNEFGVRRHRGERWLVRGQEPWIAASALQVSGDHNIANALAALAIGHTLGLRREPMLTALRQFTGLAHRTTLIRDHAGVRWFDDSKGTNVGATIAAVRGVPGQQVVLIAGGDSKDQDFSSLRAALADRARMVILIGRDAPQIASALGNSIPMQHAADMEQAIAMAAQSAQAGDSVLLSPACASFDMFSGYEERGTVFTTMVRGLPTC